MGRRRSKWKSMLGHSDVQVTFWINDASLMRDIKMCGEVVFIDTYAQIVVLNCRGNVAEMICRYGDVKLVSNIQIRKPCIPVCYT